MTKLITRIFVVLAVLGLAMGAVSCNKNNKKDTGVGFWKVESENAEEAGSSNLYHAWYFFHEDDDAFDVCFSDEDVFSNRENSNWAYIDLDKSFCGVEHALTESLNSDDWGFCGGTRTLLFSQETDDSGFTEGTVFLSVNMDNNSVVFRLNGTTKSGAKVKIDYVGSAKRMDDFVRPRLK